IEDLWLSQSPPGERLDEFVRKEWDHEPHTGETPASVLAEVNRFSTNAAAIVECVAPFPTKHMEEFERFRKDVECIRILGRHYADKVAAAEHVLRFQLSADVRDLEQAEESLAASMEDYEALAAEAFTAYRFANSMQTSQRKIPFPGGANGIGTNYLW